MDKVRPITIVGIFLAVASLLLIPYDLRVAALLALLAVMVGIRNLMTAD